MDEKAPTTEELSAAGVEITTAAASSPARVRFEQVDDLPDKPRSDVKIRLEDGTEFRERMVRVAQAQGGAAEAGFNVVITNALVGADGRVIRDAEGRPRVSPPEVRHEFSVSGEDMGAMSPAQIEAALTHAREVAAARHRAYFEGMDKGAAVFGARLDP